MNENNLESTTIARRTLIKGDVFFSGPAIIGGRIEGNIVAPESLQIVAEGSFEGDLQGTVVDILGKVKGTIVATQACWLRPTARVSAELRASTLAIEEGACFVGPVCVGGTRATIDEALEEAALESTPATSGNFHRLEARTNGEPVPQLHVMNENVQRMKVAAAAH